MEKLADNLQRLGEDDLLRVVEMVHDHKTAETYTKNDVERKSWMSGAIGGKGANGCCRGRIPRGSLHVAR